MKDLESQVTQIKVGQKKKNQYNYYKQWLEGKKEKNLNGSW